MGDRRSLRLLYEEVACTEVDGFEGIEVLMIKGEAQGLKKGQVQIVNYLYAELWRTSDMQIKPTNWTYQIFGVYENATEFGLKPGELDYLSELLDAPTNRRDIIKENVETFVFEKVLKIQYKKEAKKGKKEGEFEEVLKLH